MTIGIYRLIDYGKTENGLPGPVFEMRRCSMSSDPIHAVTGAYGYSGKSIAQRPLDQGQTVITLTNSISRANPFGDRLKAFPFDFDQPGLMAERLKGISVLYNTYWVRFNHRLFKHADAVQNTLTRDEIAGLMDGLLYVNSPPTGTTVLTEWVKKHADTLGRKDTSELARRKDRCSAYASN